MWKVLFTWVIVADSGTSTLGTYTSSLPKSIICKRGTSVESVTRSRSLAQEKLTNGKLLALLPVRQACFRTFF